MCIETLSSKLYESQARTYCHFSCIQTLGWTRTLKYRVIQSSFGSFYLDNKWTRNETFCILIEKRNVIRVFFYGCVRMSEAFAGSGTLPCDTLMHPLDRINNRNRMVDLHFWRCIFRFDIRMIYIKGCVFL